MLIIQDKLISNDIIEQRFVCNLNACKGACCVEGDMGAPLEKDELSILDTIYEDVRPFLTASGIEAIEQQGKWIRSKDRQYYTPLIHEGPCAYIQYADDGTALCGIELAYKAGKTDFMKPISCHLYPIRVNYLPQQSFEALNYDEWHICSAACTLGNELKVRVYEFLKEPLIRKYGLEFYKELEAAAAYMKEKE